MDKAWKREERTVASMFGTSRQLMKGTDEKSDIISGLFCVDVKLRKRWSIQQWYRDLREAARRQGAGVLELDDLPALTTDSE